MPARYEGNDLITMGCTFLVTGTATGGQVLAAINNPSTSLSKVVVLGLMGHIYATTQVLGRQFQTNWSAALATGGTAIAQRKLRTSQQTHPVPLIVLGAMSADASGSTAITAGSSPVRVYAPVSPSGFQAFTALAAGDTQNWDLLHPTAPPPELEPGESLCVTCDLSADSYVRVSFICLQTRTP